MGNQAPGKLNRVKERDGEAAPKAARPPGLKPRRQISVQEGQQLIIDNYEIGKVLGEGGFGEVREGVSRSDGKRVAIKKLSKLKYNTAQDHMDMVTEVDMLMRVKRHNNVVELYESFEDKSAFYIICELCEGGELLARIVEASHFSEKVASQYFKQMMLAVDHCHRNNVIHRDLKPENFLFASRAADADLKLADLGLACYIATPDALVDEVCGSAYYMAPEMFRGPYSKAVDVWGLGVLLYLLLSGTLPFGFGAPSEDEIYASIQKDPLHFDAAWNGISFSARELVSGLLEKDPRKRYTMQEALAHPWVAGTTAADTPIDRAIVKSMKTFDAHNKLRKEAMKLVASTLTASDVQALRASFLRIDTDNTGYITFSELAMAMGEMGMDKSAIHSLMKTLDADGDGRISWQEFLAATAERQLVSHQNNIWWAFCEYDKDGNGVLTMDEVRSILKDEPPDMVEKYLREYDLNGDGNIDYEEFVRMLLPKDLKYRVTPASTEAA